MKSKIFPQRMENGIFQKNTERSSRLCHKEVSYLYDVLQKISDQTNLPIALCCRCMLVMDLQTKESVKNKEPAGLLV